MFNKFFYTFEFYSKIISSLITKGFNDKPTAPLGEDEYYYSINRIYTKNKVRKMLFIDELPKYVDAGFLHEMKKLVDIKSNQLNTTYNTNIKCELLDVIISEPYNLDFSTFKNRSKINMWKKRYDNAMKESGRMSDLDELTADADIINKRDKNSWMIESWMFIKKLQEEEKGEFCKTTIILELISDSDDMLEACETELRNYLHLHEIKVKEVFLQSNEYNKSFTPAGNEYGNSLISKMNPPNILSDSLINKLDIPTHGRVGDDTGVCFGTDIHSALPIFYDVGKGSDAVNILLSASTGEGKSNYMKGIFSAFDVCGYNTIILDYEGDEYSPLANLYDSIVIKVSGAETRYFNTIAIGDLTGISKIDKDLKTEAIKITERVFSLLLDEKNGMTAHELSLYSDCINRVFEKFEVSDDPNTWYRSKECTFYHIYGELVEMSKEDKYERDYGQHIHDMIIKLRTYFEYDGINKNMFINPINLDELLGSKHIVFSFGMKGVDESLINTKELALKQLFVGYITTLVSNYNKSRNQHTVVTIEEMQRYLTHAHSASVVNNMVSGGRKRGMIMFLITNAPLQLMTHLNTKDSNADEVKHIDSILNNINVHILGRLKDNSSVNLAEYYGLTNAIPHLKLINGGGNKMKYSFLIHYKGEFSIVKYLLHPQLLKTELYSTRDNKKGTDSYNQSSNVHIKEKLKKFEGYS